MSATANRTITTLLTPPEFFFSGAMTVDTTTTISTTYAYPGAKFHMKRKATGLLIGVILNGLGIKLGLGGWAIIEYDGTAWQELASGGLL